VPSTLVAQEKQPSHDPMK